MGYGQWQKISTPGTAPPHPAAIGVSRRLRGPFSANPSMPTSLSLRRHGAFIKIAKYHGFRKTARTEREDAGRAFGTAANRRDCRRSATSNSSSPGTGAPCAARRMRWRRPFSTLPIGCKPPPAKKGDPAGGGVSRSNGPVTLRSWQCCGNRRARSGERRPWRKPRIEDIECPWRDWCEGEAHSHRTREDWDLYSLVDESR